MRIAPAQTTASCSATVSMDESNDNLNQTQIFLSNPAGTVACRHGGLSTRMTDEFPPSTSEKARLAHASSMLGNKTPCFSRFQQHFGNCSPVSLRSESEARSLCTGCGSSLSGRRIGNTCDAIYACDECNISFKLPLLDFHVEVVEDPHLLGGNTELDGTLYKGAKLVANIVKTGVNEKVSAAGPIGFSNLRHEEYDLKMPDLGIVLQVKLHGLKVSGRRRSNVVVKYVSEGYPASNGKLQVPRVLQSYKSFCPKTLLG